LIEGIADVIWADENGRAGILFKELTSASRKRLQTWLLKRTEESAVAGVPSRSRKASISQLMH